MDSLIEFTDRNGQVLRAFPVAIMGDITDVSVETGSKTEYLDTDGRPIHATPLVIVEDFRPGGGGGGGGGGGLADGNYGDVVVSAGGTVMTIPSGRLAVTELAAITAGVLGLATGTAAPVVMTFAALKASLGLGNVDNTSDTAKHTNTALTGVPTAPTASLGTSTTQLATTAFVAAGLATVGELAQDAVANALAAGTHVGISFTYDDATGSINGTVTASGSGDMSGAASSVDSELVLFSGTTGKVVKRATGTGLVQLVSGVVSTVDGGNDDLLQRKGGAWVTRNIAQVNADLQGTGLGGSDVGFRHVPQNLQSANYTAVAADAGKHLLHPSADVTARTFTIPANATVPYPLGTAISFVNQDSAGALTIAINTDTMRLAGPGTTGSRALAANGVATAIKLTATEWIISGVGLS